MADCGGSRHWRRGYVALRYIESLQSQSGLSPLDDDGPVTIEGNPAQQQLLADQLQQAEQDTAKINAQRSREAASLAKIEFRKASTDLKSIERLVEEVAAEVVRWDEEVVTLLTSEPGKRIAGNKSAVRAFQANFILARPSREEIENCRLDLEELRSLIDEESLVPPPAAFHTQATALRTPHVRLPDALPATA